MRRRFLIAAWFAVMLPCCESRQAGAPREKEAAPAVEVKAEVDKATATTGDLIRYTLSAISDPSVRVELPEMGSQIAGLRILDMGRKGPEEKEGRLHWKKWYQLKADLIGSYIIPGAVFFSYNDKGEKKEHKTAQIFIEVKSVIEDKAAATDIKEIKPLETISRDYTAIALYALGGVALLALILGGIFWYRLKYKKAAATPPRPAHELAFEELEGLRKEGLIEKGIYKEHYFKFSEIFRRYLERRFHFPAVEQTTEEILPALSGLTGFEERVRSGARSLLVQADLVKFARHTPTNEQVEQGYRQAVSFIHETKEDPLPPSPAASHDSI
jgi:hypothetical protein